MSKKTRKKSPKTPARKVAPASSKTSPKKPAAKARKAAVKKSAKTTTVRRAPTAPDKAPKTTAKTTAKTTNKTLATESHKAPSKPLMSEAPVKTALAEGAKAPSFQLPRDGGDTVSLGDFKGKKLVLFFYPRADTPGCTKEAIEFTRLAGAFAENQAAILGVSADPLKAQESFRNKHQLSIPLASDEKHEMLEAYGVWGEKSMYGKTFQGILRTTVLIGEDGRVIRIWRHVRVDGHADEVLAAVRTH